MGQNSQAASYAVAIGKGSNASAADTIAIGMDTKTTSESAIAIGSGKNSVGTNSLTLGQNASAGGSSAVAVGQDAAASENDATAIGQGATAAAQYATALGQGATASGTNSLALGQGATASAAGSVSIGTGSTNTRANTVSFGSSSQQRQLTSVAAATEDTDAINYGQLQDAINTYLRTGVTHSEVDRMGASSAAVMAMMPLPYQANTRFQGSLGLGHYGTKTAAAVGLAYQLHEAMLCQISTTVGGDTPMVSMGFSWQFGLSTSPRKYRMRKNSDRIDEISSKYREKKDHFEVAEENVKALRSQYQQKQQTVRQLRYKISKTVLPADTIRLEQKLEKEKGELDNLHTKLKALNGDYLLVKSQMRRERNEIDALVQENRLLAQQKDKEKRALATQSGQLKDLEEAAAERRAKIAALQESLQRREGQLKALMREIRSLKAAMNGEQEGK